MKQLGQIVKFCCPVFLFLGPVLISLDLCKSLSGIFGGIILGFGLVGLYYRIGK